jgi:hypothetical protein
LKYKTASFAAAIPGSSTNSCTTLYPFLVIASVLCEAISFCVVRTARSAYTIPRSTQQYEKDDYHNQADTGILPIRLLIDR